MDALGRSVGKEPVHAKKQVLMAAWLAKIDRVVNDHNAWLRFILLSL